MQKFPMFGCLLLISCVTVRHIEITPIESGEDAGSPITVKSPVKAHLVDGSTVIFSKGLSDEDHKVRDQGFHALDWMHDDLDRLWPTPRKICNVHGSWPPKAIT
jgi:hypothetical protein